MQKTYAREQVKIITDLGQEGEDYLRKIAAFIGSYVNGGSAMVLMGLQWLYLWLFPWYGMIAANPQWGHNLVMSMAFIAVGLAYYHRRLASDILAVLSAVLTLPASIDSLPADWSPILAAILLLAIFLDILTEGKKPYAWFSGNKPVLSGRLKKYLLCLAYIFLAGIVIIYFAVRLPGGTYDSDIDTLLFDALLIPFLFLLFMERTGREYLTPYFRLSGFFWGGLTMVVILVLMMDQPETWPNLILTMVVTLIGAAATWANWRQQSSRS
jgi:hypothetical protein